MKFLLLLPLLLAGCATSASTVTVLRVDPPVYWIEYPRPVFYHYPPLYHHQAIIHPHFRR